MLIVIKTKESKLEAAKIGEAMKRLDGVIDVDSFDIYDEREYGITKMFPVYNWDALPKLLEKDKEKEKKEFFTAAEVRAMSLSEVGANYAKILKSIAKWGAEK